MVHHPQVEIVSVISSSSAGVPISDGFPHLTDIVVQDLDGVEVHEIAAKADLVFTATPSGVSTKLVPQLLDVGLKVIDLSGDFRLRSGEMYEAWYKKPAASPNISSKRYTDSVRCMQKSWRAFLLFQIQAAIRLQHYWGLFLC